MGSRSDDDYWNDKYEETELSHSKCEGSEMWYDRTAGAWICYECGDEVDE